MRSPRSPPSYGRIAQVRPRKRRRWKLLKQQRPDLFQRAAEAGLLDHLEPEQLGQCDADTWSDANRNCHRNSRAAAGYFFARECGSHTDAPRPPNPAREELAAISSTAATAQPSHSAKERAGSCPLWEAEKWVIHGKDTSDGRDGRSYRIDKGRMVCVIDGKDIGVANFKVDVSDKPFKMDVTYVGGPRDGQTLLGIFRFDDGKLINCFSCPGDPRPTSFESTAANRYFLSINRKKIE